MEENVEQLQVVNKKIAIIDLDSVAFSAFNPNKELTPGGNPKMKDGKFVYYDKTEDEVRDTADLLIIKMLQDSEATHYVAYIKGKGNFRYTLNSTYKSNRPKSSPPLWQCFKDHVISKWKAIEVNGIEVDDAVNITRLNLKDSFICAIDKDLLMLESINPHYNWRKNEWNTTTKEQAYHKLWQDVIIGQSGDGIKGIKGIGEVGANKILTDPMNYPSQVLNKYMEVYGEVEGINEFYKNYRSLLILDKYEGFIIPEIIPFTEEEVINGGQEYF